MTNLMEVIQPIQEFPKYKISNYGRIWHTTTNIEITPYHVYKKNGRKHRLMVFLRNGTQSKNSIVHRLVMKMFGVPSPGINYSIDHIDRDPFNNRIDNLRWLTQKEQCNNRIQIRKSIRKISESDLNTIYLRNKEESLPLIAKDYSTYPQVLATLLRYMHPLY